MKLRKAWFFPWVVRLSVIIVLDYKQKSRYSTSCDSADIKIQSVAVFLSSTTARTTFPSQYSCSLRFDYNGGPFRC